MKFKILAISALAIAVSVFTMGAYFNNSIKRGSQPDSRGHVLSELWSDYTKAKNKDLPETQSDILQKIKSESLKERLAWDYYDASREYVRVESSRNWKLRDSLKSELAAGVKSFGEPIMTYVLMCEWENTDCDKLFQYVESEADALRKSNNKGFYFFSAGSGSLPQWMREYIKDDYVFALWTIFSDYGTSRATKDSVRAALESHAGNSYPIGAYLEFLKAESLEPRSVRRGTLEDFVAKYEGKAISLYAKAVLLESRFSDLEDDVKSSSEDYKKLYEDVVSFGKERSAYSGSEKPIALGSDDVVSQLECLTEKNVKISVENGRIEFQTRNVSAFDVTLTPDVKDAKALLDTSLVNPVCRFYVQDTLTLELPGLDDGDYNIVAKSGKFKSVCAYHSFHVSLAVQRDSRGDCIYAADYISGKPLEKVDLCLKKNGMTVAEYKDFVLDGFTPLPAELVSRMSDTESYYYLSCSYTDDSGYVRKSPEISIDRYARSAGDETNKKSNLECNFYTDRAAYNPGDSIDFKVVLFRTDYYTFAKTLPTSEKIKVHLENADGKVIDSLVLETNEFGSAAGAFAVPESGKNGMWTLRAETMTGRMIGYGRRIRIDEFVLPTFAVEFDDVKDICLPGDEVTLTGKIISYQGHPVSSAKSRYSVKCRDALISEGDLSVAADGKFAVSFIAPGGEENGFYRYSSCCEISVEVVDATGETHEYVKTLWVERRISVEVSLENGTDGNVSLLKDYGGVENYYPSYMPIAILKEDTAKFNIFVQTSEGGAAPVPVHYVLTDEKGAVLRESVVESGETQLIDLSRYRSGLYLVKADASARSDSGFECRDSSCLGILLVRDGDSVLDAPVRDLIFAREGEIAEGGTIDIMLGTADGAPVWAVVELFGPNEEVLESRMLYLEGRRGEQGSLTKVSFDYKKEYYDVVRVKVFYFKNLSSVSCMREFRRVKTELVMPLSFTSFIDKTLPASRQTISVKTLPWAECLAAVFDKSTETVAPNDWNIFRLREKYISDIWINTRCGSDGCSPHYGGIGRGHFLTKNAPEVMGERAMYVADANLALNESMAPEMLGGSGVDDVAVRSDFSENLAFLPFLRSDADGNISFSFNTSDKLSTYIVSLYAHDKDMRNAAFRREMLVTIPVKVGLVEPKYLYSDDNYRLAATVSSVSDSSLRGKVTLSIYAGGDYEFLHDSGAKPLSVQSGVVEVLPNESVRLMFDVDVKSLLKNAGTDVDTLGLKLVLSSEQDAGAKSPSYSDGVFVPVKILPAVQTIRESHSAVLLSGADRDSLVAGLRKEFVNMDGADADVRDISILDMVLEAIPDKAEPANNDLLSLSEAWYVRNVASMLKSGSDAGNDPARENVNVPDEMLWRKMFACHNADGGFGWYEGMNSSPIITAVFLERIYKMKKMGFIDGEETVSGDSCGCDRIGDVIESAVKYLDDRQFVGQSQIPFWCGGLSDEQYMYVRSMFAYVPFEVCGNGSAIARKCFKVRLAAFKKYAAGYLVPKHVRGLNGMIISKVRRTCILLNLCTSDSGIALAKSWGISLFARSKMEKSLRSDISSLLEYAVEHKDGCVYFPNAVMPFRGLLESEAYAHSMICDLLSRYLKDYGGKDSDIADEARRASDGVRVWLMLQKETQHWDETPEFVDALNSVLSGSDAVKSTRVVVLSSAKRKQFEDVKACGNGFKVARMFFRETSDKESGKIVKEAIRPGDRLRVGDKIIAEYHIHNDENRSFVKLSATREAALRPVKQLSGHYGWWLSPLRLDGWYSFVPQGYRNVKAAVTEYSFDSYPEGDTVITEEFFITQSGEFVAPAVEIESLYAPHYRAVGGFSGKLESLE